MKLLKKRKNGFEKLEDHGAGWRHCRLCDLHNLHTLLLRIGCTVWKQFTMWGLKGVAGHPNNENLQWSVCGGGVPSDAPWKRTRNLLGQKGAGEKEDQGQTLVESLWREELMWVPWALTEVVADISSFWLCWLLKGRSAWSDREVSLLLACTL